MAQLENKQCKVGIDKGESVNFLANKHEFYPVKKKTRAGEMRIPKCSL